MTTGGKRKVPFKGAYAKRYKYGLAHTIFKQVLNLKKPTAATFVFYALLLALLFSLAMFL